MRTIGVISDTHGLLRDEALAELASAELIIHAGDVGSREILDRLEEVAPVFAVRGNTDHGTFGASLPVTEAVPLHTESSDPEAVVAYVVHDIDDLDLDPAASGFAVVVYGHSHRPGIEWRSGVLYFNPGAAGHRRFDLPITVGRLRIAEDGTIEPEIVDLGVT